jgi:hypothetical protein
MRRSLSRLTLVAVTVGVVAALATICVFVADVGDSGSQWYWPLLMPSFLGMIAVGGVHSGASETSMVVACGVSNGTVWGGATFVLGRLLRIIARHRNSGHSPPAT